MLKLNPGQRRASKLLSAPQRHTCFVGGSRSGKTTLLVNAVLIRALRAPRSRHGIFRQRANAVKTSIALDTLPKVARLRFPGLELEPHKQEGYFTLPNQSEIWIDGLDDAERVDKILGREYATMFFNECSQIPYQTILTALTRLAQVAEVDGGGRLSQRAYYDLNPVGRSHWTNTLFGDRRDPATRQPLRNPDDYARIFLNPRENEENLTAEYVQSLADLPERQRKRFYEGVYVDEFEGALWTYEGLERGRVDELPEDQRRRVVVGVDPSGAGSSEDVTRDEIGIVVVALGQDGHGYVLADRTLLDGPAAWGRAAVTAYHEFGADCIVAEENFGGAMVKSVIKTADPQVSVRLVHASRGKAVRAEPVSALYGEPPEFKNIRVHHVGRHGRLEDEQVAFTSGGYRGEDSPNRVDALVWAITELMLSSSAEAWISYLSKMTDQARAESEKPKTDRPVEEKLEEPKSSVADAYNRVVRREMRDEVLCAWCGEELAGSSRTVSGPDQYHEACYPAALRAGKKQDA